MNTTETPAEIWAVVEVMGHTRYAGRVSQHAALGGALIRVEVPAILNDQGTEEIPAFEKLLAPAAIFAITPTTEILAREAARRFRTRPFTILDLPELVRRPRLPGIERHPDDHVDEYGDDYPDPI